ncbi:MAG: SsrA-binding protein SmpB [Planctomycetes bacterium]|nr:SsrA-binding protein SmpB [Planctomycetota bacterium]
MEIIAKNRKAFYQYEILEKIEAGIVLTGTEVKSLRNKDVSINDSFAQIDRGEVFLYEMHIGEYKQGNRQNHEPKRKRKLLLHKREIAKIAGKVKQKGCTIIPLSLYFKNELAKLEIALVRGKTKFDKREDIKKRTVEREIRQVMKKF